MQWMTLIIIIMLLITFNAVGCKLEPRENKPLSPKNTVSRYISNMTNGRVLDAYEMVLNTYKERQTIIDFWDSETRGSPFWYDDDFKITGVRYREPPSQRITVFVKFPKETKQFDLSKEDGEWKLQIGGEL